MAASRAAIAPPPPAVAAAMANQDHNQHHECMNPSIGGQVRPRRFRRPRPRMMQAALCVAPLMALLSLLLVLAPQATSASPTSGHTRDSGGGRGTTTRLRGPQEGEVTGAHTQASATTAPANDDDDDKSGRAMESLLLSQLSDLIMNNEPAVIRQKLASERIEGQLAAETNRLLLAAMQHSGRPGGGSGSLLEASPLSGRRRDDFDEQDTQDFAQAAAAAELRAEDEQRTKQHAKRRRHSPASAPEPGAAEPNGGGGGVSSAEDEADENENENADVPAGSAAESKFLQEGQQDEQQQQQQQQPTVTCSPDYEDQTVLMDHEDPGQLGELLASSSMNMSGAQTTQMNLTLEQRQQLLAGADLSSLLQHTTAGNGSQQLQLAIGQCVPAGSRMIEMITKVITPILFTIIIIVGLLGNIIVMLVILEDRQVERELTPTNLLILDLSLADLSFIVLCIPFTGWDYAVGHWVFGSLWCKFNQYLIVVCALSSIYTLVLMSCDRFMAIVYPIECISYRTSANMLHAIVIKWIVILAVASPTIFMHGLVDSPLGPDQYNCRFLSDHFNPLHFQFIFFITSYFLPLVLIFFLYLSLLRRLWCGAKPHGHKESHKMLESKKKVTWLVASIVLVFAACWFPIQIMLILMRLKTHKITATYVAVQVFAHTLGYMNSCVNPIVYAFASDTFNQSFKKSRLGRLCLTYLCCQAWRTTSGVGTQVNSNTNAQHQSNHQNNNNNHSNHLHSLSTTNGHYHAGTSVNMAASGSQQQQQQHLASTSSLVASAALGGSSCRRSGGATSRNSLQITTTSQMAPPGGGGGGGGASSPQVVARHERGNKSLSHIFTPMPAAAATEEDVQIPDPAAQEEGSNHLSRPAGGPENHCQKPRPLALEPRDRPTMARNPSGLRISGSSSASQLGATQVQQQHQQQQQHQPARQLVVAHDGVGGGQPRSELLAGGSCDDVQQQQHRT